MPSASKSKSKERSTAKAAKEQLTSSKPLGNGALSTVYSANSETFHILDQAQRDFVLGNQSNGKFRTMDELEEHSGSSNGTSGEFDCVSNNGSCSGESEDQRKKSSSNAPRSESVPGSDVDKREKIRQKNEKKHQRQKERRAQELHERCKGYLMSRKLETLSQQLVSMGFSSEQATMALIQNEGRIEESIAWLFDGGEETSQHVAANLQSTGDLKIDITDEYAKMLAMEAKFGCTKQEVERAVVQCEGDLTKTEHVLLEKQESAAKDPKPEEFSDSSGFASKAMMLSENQNVRQQVNGAVSPGAQQTKRDMKDLYYTKLLQSRGNPQEPVMVSKAMQPSVAPQIKQDMARHQFAVQPDKRRPPPSVSYSSPSPLPGVLPPQMKQEALFMAQTKEMKAAQQNASLREPVIVMQRPQATPGKQSAAPVTHSLFAAEPAPVSRSVFASQPPPPNHSVFASQPPPANHRPFSAGPSPRDWHLNGGTSGLDMMMLNGGGLGNGMRNLSLDTASSSRQFHHPSFPQPFVSNAMDHVSSGGWGGVPRSSGGAAPSPALTAASSLGLFGGWSSPSSGASSTTDGRSSGSSPFDYTTVDWSLDTTQLMPSVKSDWPSDTWSTRFMGGRSPSPFGSDGSAGGFGGLHENSRPMNPMPSAGSYDWSSFVAGDDHLLRASSKVVGPPTLKR